MKKKRSSSWEGWSWTKFWIGKLSNKLIAWTVYMILQFIALLTGIVPKEYIGTVITWSGIITVIFMLAGAIDNAVSNATITLEAKYGRTKSE